MKAAILLQDLFQRRAGFITVVSGLPRSGTSMMMQMLDAGGMPILTDHLRASDVSNPRGYYEYEPVKSLGKGDTGWLQQANGKAVKIISALLQHLPPDFHYKIIFIDRDLKEVLASQRKMLIDQETGPDSIPDEEMEQIYIRHLAQVKRWLASRPNMQTLYLTYHEILAEPERHVQEIRDFLGVALDTSRMMGVIDSNLYRQRRVKVHESTANGAEG